MDQTKQANIGPPPKRTVTLASSQTDVWMPATQKVIEFVQPVESPQTRGNAHACKVFRRDYQRALDLFKRADRDLGETAAFIAASLTTVTAIQAVISIAKGELGLSQEVLQLAFHSYIAIFILIFVLGAFRARSAIRRRSQAEKDIDQAKKGIFEFCPMDQWPKPEE